MNDLSERFLDFGRRQFGCVGIFLNLSRGNILENNQLRPQEQITTKHAVQKAEKILFTNFKYH